MENKARELVKELLNGTLKPTEAQNIFELAYCKVCGNYELYEELDKRLDGTYNCKFCEHAVCEEEIVMPSFKKEERKWTIKVFI